MAETAPGTRLIARPGAIASLARLLRIPPAEAGRGWYLEHADGLWSERLKLTLRVGDADFVFHLKPADAEGAFVRSDEVAICFEGTETTPRIERFLHEVARQIKGWSLNGLLALLDEDRSLRDDSQAGVSGPAGTHETGWRSFFARGDFEYEARDPIWTGGRTTVLEHGDRECFHSHPWPDAHKWSFFNDPRKSLPGPGARDSRLDIEYIVSEIGEADVVLGAKERLDALLAAARSVADRTELYLVNHLCTPVVIGDDLDGLAWRCEEATGRPVLALSRDAKAEGSTLERLLVLARSRPSREPAPDPDPKRINLLGFPRYFCEDELEPLIVALGLTVNAVQVPEVDLESLGRLDRAGLHLFPEASPFADVLQRRLGERPGARVVPLPAPYGVAGTRACLAAVAAAAGRTEAFEPWWQQRWASTAGPWASACEAAQGFRLALVSDELEMQQLIEPATMGLPLLPVLDEMGFGLDLLQFTRQSAGTDGSGVPSGLEDRDVAIHPFRNARELHELLAAGRFRAVYSDFACDWRITSAGKASFSRRHFTPGLAGALSSAEALLTVCRLPFFRRYASHLARLPGRHDGG